MSAHPRKENAPGGNWGAVEAKQDLSESGGDSSTSFPNGHDPGYSTVEQGGQIDPEQLALELPERMKAARRWLLWKAIPQPGGKPRKVPYYTNGEPRGPTDTPEDQARMGTFAEALAVLERGGYAGPGFALGPDGTGNCWQGVDLDHITEHRELEPLIEPEPGYVERSPSRDGYHILGYGPEFPSLSKNATGIEAYSRGRYFTVTGDSLGGDLADLSQFVRAVLEPMHAKGRGNGEGHKPPADGFEECVSPRTITDLKSALTAIRADDYGVWIAMGHALKSIGKPGRSLWIEWSQTSTKWRPEDARRWDTFQPTATNYRAVFAEAGRRGWLNPLSGAASVAGSGVTEAAPALSDEALKLKGALAVIPATAVSEKHPIATVIGLALRHETSGLTEVEGGALCDEWDRRTGGKSLQKFKAADPGYCATEPITTASVYDCARKHGWKGEVDPGPWGDPQPLLAKIAPEPYPLDALPETIRAAVGEVAGFVQAPVSLVASSALGALSLACQAHIDVRRAEGLQGPSGLFILVIADSGERKSTCDGFFSKPIIEYERAQAEAAKPALKDYQAATEAWEARRSGIKEKIRQLAKAQRSTREMEVALRALETDKPEPPRIPSLSYADATPEALAYGLAKQWPSGGVVSAEAGIVFGSHGMGKDSVMRNLALLNQLWDGARLKVDRRTSESFTLGGARLTVALQVQEPTLRDFLERAGALARGSGFLARFLVAWPESTQGYRPFVEPPANWPRLAAFHRRLATILAFSAPTGEDGSLTPPLISLAPEAKEAWVSFHDAIEGELRSGGELCDVRDVASKTADNAVRLAALFHLFAGTGGAIGLEAFEGASRICAWHLSESRRFFGELALPGELADAVRLDSWLLGHCQRERTREVGKNHIRQHGPLRDGVRLNAAIRELGNLDRLRLEKSGKRLMVHINPQLQGVAP